MSETQSDFYNGCLVSIGIICFFLLLLLFGSIFSLFDNIAFQIIMVLFIISPFGIYAYEQIIIAPNKAFERAQNGSGKDIDFLIDRVVNCSLFSLYSTNQLSKLTSSQAIDIFCQRWKNNRNQKLTKILLKANYVATQPGNLRVLTALKVGKIKTCIDQNPQLVKWLLLAFEDQDLDIASRAKKYAINLINQSAIDELFYLCVEESNQIAYQCIQQAQYQSTNIKYKAFFHFLRDEWTAYDDLDFDQAILQQIYQSVSPELRKTIAEKARKRGWTEWLTVAKKSREKMTPEEWEITFSILKNNREFTKMWLLVRQSPVWVAHKLLVELSQSSYQSSPEGNIFYQSLLLLASHCYTLKTSEIDAKNESQLLLSAGRYKEISPDCQFLLTDDNGNTKVWRIADGQLLLSADRNYQVISPDWQFFLTSNKEDTKVRKMADGQLLFSAQGEYKEISPDWKFLLTDDNGNTKVWRIADGQLLFSAQGEYRAINPDWQFLFTDYNGKTKVWRMTDGQLLFSAQGEYRAINPDWQFLVTADTRHGGKNLKVWRIADDQLLLSAQGYYREISPDCQFLLTYDYGNTKIWRITNGQLLFSAQGEYKKISPDCQFLLTYDYGNTKVWRIADGQLLFSAKGKYQCIHPDWQFLVTGDREKTKVWRIADGQLLFFAQGYRTISPDWQFLLTRGDYGENPKVWRIADGQLLFSAQEYYKNLSPDWQFFVTSNKEDTKVRKMADGQLLFSAQGDYRAINPDWQFLLTYDYGTTKVWRIADGQLLFSAQGDYKNLSPDWQFLLTDDNGTTKVWRIADGQLLLSAQGEYRAISPDWQFLLTLTKEGYDRNPKVWRIADDQLLLSAQEDYRAISPDWQFLITTTGSYDKDLRVWRILDTRKIANYYCHKFTDQLTIQDINLLQYLKKNPVSDYVYPIVTEEQKPWLDLMIKLAEYNLSFDVDITEDSPPAEMSDFDIEIEG